MITFHLYSYYLKILYVEKVYIFYILYHSYRQKMIQIKKTIYNIYLFYKNYELGKKTYKKQWTILLKI